MAEWLEDRWRRLRSQWRHTLGFAAVGALIGELREVPKWMERATNQDPEWLLFTVAREGVSVFIAALIMVAALRLATDNGSDLVSRPRRFLLLLLAGSTIATTLSWSVYALMELGARGDMELKPEKVFDFWLQVLLWGGLIGWLYLLNLQRVTNQRTLAALLGRRALLARQLTHARLGKARAEVDPAMVARVLSVVHARYQDESASASALLDRLISYLRLAMNRRQSSPSDTDDELAALRAQLEKDMQCEPAPRAP